MCGIAGIFNLGNTEREQRLGAMLRSIRHRGQDDAGSWSDQGISLGHNRLSIIDTTEGGHQPLANEDGTVWVVLNGEIYNFKELRRSLEARGHRFRGASDTEVLPHLYEEHGAEFVTHLRGMFAFALWDTRRRRLLLVRDRAGKKPLFYAQTRDGMAFASEMKALFTLPEIDLSVRPEGITDYLRNGAITGPKTIYRGIRRVPAGHYAIVDANGQMTEHRYWNLKFHPKQKITREEAISGIGDRLREAVRLRLRSDVPVGCFLSGGIDSGLITALAAEQSDSRLRTFTIGFDDHSFDERELARSVADRYQTDHLELVVTPTSAEAIPAIVRHFDEPFSDPSMIPSFAVAALAAEHVKVVLNGDGADEVFAGYRHVQAARLLARLDRYGLRHCAPLIGMVLGRLPYPSTGRSGYQFAHRLLRALNAKGFRRFSILTNDRLDGDELGRLFDCRPEQVPGQPAAEIHQQDSLGAIDAMLSFDFHQLLGGEHLVKMDMSSMAHTLEARSPFLDHELVEYAATLPEHLKLGGGATKPLLRALAEKRLPRAVTTAPKRGFDIPLQRWMEKDLNVLLRERLFDPASLSKSIFDANRLQALVDGTGWDRKRWGAIVWSLLCLEFWWDGYRDTQRGRKQPAYVPALVTGEPTPFRKIAPVTGRPSRPRRSTACA